MGVINAERMLQFRSTKELFSRINGFLESFAANNLIDTGDFWDYIIYMYDQLGVGIFKECEALVEVKHHVAKLPCNFKLWYAAYKCHRNAGGEGVPSINEQQPWIWYQQAELSTVCADDMNLEKTGPHGEVVKNKLVIRTFVNGDPFFNEFHGMQPLYLGPNVKDYHDPHCMKVVPAGWNEVTIDQDKTMRFRFEHDHVYMQYYGIPFDEDYLPMIPDESSIEKAIEFYIYTQLFEKWYLNSTVPNIADKLAYVKREYAYHFAQARYWVKLPSFQKMCQSIRTMKGNLKFYNPTNDRTRVGYRNWGFGNGSGFYPW
jgi:hypothetical protein